MKLITKRITLDVLLYTLLASVVLLSLVAFFEIVVQLRRLGDQPTSHALLLTAVLMPLRFYQFLPVCVLIGSVLAMSSLATHSEFTAMRVGGLSPWRLLKIIAVPATVLLMLTYFIGEVVNPPLLRYETEVKTQAGNQDALTPRGFRTGVWLRDLSTDEQGRTLDRFVNVAYVKANNRQQTGPWRVFEYNDKGDLVSLTRAASGHYDADRGWILDDVTQTTYPDVPLMPKVESATPGNVVQQHFDTQVFNAKLGPDIFGTLTTRTDEMSMRELYGYIEHLEKNNQKNYQQKLIFFQKLFYPLGILVMLLTGLPFAYMSRRHGSVVLKVFAGLLVGIVFYSVNSMFAFLGLLDGTPPALLLIIPPVVMIAFLMGALYWLERR